MELFFRVEQKYDWRIAQQTAQLNNTGIVAFRFRVYLRNPSSLISDDLVIPRTVVKHIPPRVWNLIHRSPRTRQQVSCLPLLRCSLLPTKSAVLFPQRCRVQLVRRGYLRCFHASPCCCSARDSCELKSRWNNTTPDWARSSCRALINISSPLVSTRRDSSVGRTRNEIGSWSKLLVWERWAIHLCGEAHKQCQEWSFPVCVVGCFVHGIGEQLRFHWFAECRGIVLWFECGSKSRVDFLFRKAKRADPERFPTTMMSGRNRLGYIANSGELDSAFQPKSKKRWAESRRDNA